MRNSQWDQYFLARYDAEDQLLGVYEDIDEAINKVYGKDLTQKQLRTARNSICASYCKKVRSDGYRRSARGFWYKIKR